MPDYFAHEVFGQLVLERLPRPLRARLEQERLSFFCGQYGPDPMFFLFGRARDEARAMHRAPGAVPIARLAAAARAGEPESAGYLAGFLCHYLLDCACHPYVLETAARGQLGHTAIETEFDRYLLAQRGYRTDRDTPMVRKDLPDAVCQAASRAYEQTTPEHYGRAYRMFRLVCRMLAQLQGTPARAVVNGLSRLPGLRPIRGCISGRAPDAAAEETNRTLEALLQEAAAPAAAHLAAFFDALEHGAPERDALWQRDFFGRQG